ncbi:MAG: MotA/TolQ/ExbB proton channel family protein [Chlamydiae bacterium]|nr:MotA/TolQ/ExbB proton channel family protein [Chlamydiota bacterium]
MFASFVAFTAAYAQSDFFGKVIMWGLFVLSALCWFILCYKVWQAKQVQSSSEDFHQYLLKNRQQLLHLDPPKVQYRGSASLPRPFVQIYLAFKEKTLEILHKKLYFLQQKQCDASSEPYLTVNDIALVEQHVATALSSQYKLLEKHLFVLSTIVTLAPFLGLLGTVWGILVTFSELHLGGGAAGSNAAILGGISTALATTVLGLVIAIPALIAYNYLKNHLKSFASDMEDFLSSLLSHLELQYRKVETD